MVLEVDLFRLFDRLKRSCCRASDNTVHVFVAGLYVDSAVALKILTDLLRSESVQYSVFPVYGYDDILTHATKGVTQSQPYTAIFINCGATEDMGRLLSVGPNTVLFVVDCHRPIHLSNMRRGNDRVVVAGCVEDDSEDPYLARLLGADGAIDPSDSEDENGGAGSSSDDGDGSEGDDVDDHNDADDEEEDDDDGFGDVDGEGGRRKRPRGRRRGRRRGRGGDPQERAQRRARRRVRMEYYNRGSFFGKPAGCMMYDMSHTIHKDTAEQLWLACVSMTDQFVHSRLAPEQYTVGCAQLEQRVSSMGSADAPRSTTIDDGITVRVPDMSRILFEHELRLMCLPRWNLFDCMVCSTYPCTRLKTWSEPGMKRLRLLFGELGIGHAEAKQKFPYMSTKTRSRLREDLETIAPNHGLSEICFRTFQRLHGYKMRVSASDVVYGVTALLECGDRHDPESQADSFWLGLSALDLRGWKVLEEGMDLAIKVQGAIVRQGSLAMANKSAIKTTFGRRKFQYLVLEDSADTRLLAHPLALTRLLYFLLDALKEQGARPRPMVVAAMPHSMPSTSSSQSSQSSSSSSSSCLIVGITHKPRVGQLTGNKFGIAFARAAERLGTGYRQEMFESSFLELERAHVTSFFRLLQEVMNEQDDAAEEVVGRAAASVGGLD